MTSPTRRFETLFDLYEQAVAEHGDNPLFGVKRAGTWQWTTYREFNELVDRTRAALAGLGVKSGDRVAVIANNRIEWAAGCFACYGLGAAYVPMYEAQQAREWQYILNDCGAKVCLVAGQEIYAKVQAIAPELGSLERVIYFDGDSAGEDAFARLTALDAAAAVAPGKPEPSDIAHFIYTSGTTGNPKGVLLSHGNIASNLSAVQDSIPFSDTDRSLAFLPWAHAFGLVIEVLGLMALGGSIAICTAVDKLSEELAEVRPTILIAVPRVFNKIYDGVQKTIAAKPAPIRALFRRGLETQGRVSGGEQVGGLDRLVLAIARRVVFAKIVGRFGGNLRYVISGGAALSREVADFIDRLGITVYEGYGLTETSPIVTANTPLARRLGSVGKPIAGVTVKLDREAAGSDDDQGEIVVYGPNVMQGYHNLPEETAQAIGADAGFRTGDLGRFDADGFLYITGRIKEQYKLENGKYVAPAALEEKLTLSPYIGQVMVYGDNRTHNVALVVPDFIALGEWASANGAEGEPAKLVANPQVRALIRSEIDKHSVEFRGFEKIREFALLGEEFTNENGLLTPTLKLKRRKVVELHAETLDAMYAPAEARASAG
jgi:long-chain acyl-CoA synthetase